MNINFIIYSWNSEPYNLYELVIELYDRMKMNGFVYKDYNNKKMIQEEIADQLVDSIKSLREMD